MGDVGVSTPSPPPLEAPDASAPPPLPPAIPADFRARFTKLSRTRFMSQGHLIERFWVEVYANDAGRAAYESKSATAAPGAMIVAEEWEHRVDGERHGPVLMMEKRDKGFDPEHGDWRYVVVEASGKVSGDGKLDGCYRCHDDAPHDHLFTIIE
jgi:hypothetical protein